MNTPPPPKRTKLPVLSDATDKYEPRVLPLIDCESRLSLCKARCCAFTFALSKQDVDEGVVSWDPAEPYHIHKREGGYCVHCRNEGLSCEVYSARPLVCRVYDCRTDTRIWTDFDGRIPAPVSGG